jgi:hypothetical protein
MKPVLPSSVKFAQFLIILNAILVCLAHNLRAQTFGEAAYNYLGNDRPAEGNPGWHEEAQGLAHDHDNWFIAQKSTIWKIPVTNDLAAPATQGVRGVLKADIGTIGGLAGYDHFGDPEVFEPEGYLFVPVTSDEGKPKVIAVFSCEPLTYITCATTPPGADDTVDGGWCVVDPKRGELLIPNTGSPSILNRYQVNYDALTTSGRLELTPNGFIPLLLEDGTACSLQYLQGGCMSPSGELLYLVAGNISVPSEGICVFQMTNSPSGLITGRRIKRSSQDSGRFIYEFDNSEWPGPRQEPEGLTFWDLDNHRAPNIRGQLHVMLLDNDVWNPDDVSVKHYSSSLYADVAYAGGDGQGTPDRPYNTVNAANNIAWEGADLRIKYGFYPEALTFSKTMRVIAYDGPVTIGR